MKTIASFLQQDTQHEKEQKALKRFIPDIPGISDVPNGHVPQLSDNLFFQNKDIFISKHSRYAPYPEHSHQFLELNYQFSGTCQQVVNGELITLSSGDILLMDSGSVHSIYPLGKEDILINILFRNQHVSLNWLSELKGKNSLLYQSLLKETRLSNQGHYALIQSTPTSKIKMIIELILTEYFLPQDFSQSMIEHYLPILFYEITRHLPKFEENISDNPLTDPYLQTLHLIDTHYATLTLNDVAHHLNFNKNYLSNLIKEKSGQTFTALLTQKKIHKAQLLIQSTRLPINEICQQVGFSNRTYFYKLYQETFGHKPSTDR